MQREKALAEAEGRAREARENEDVNRRALSLRLEEERKKLVEAINTTFGLASPLMYYTDPLSCKGIYPLHANIVTVGVLGL